MVAWREPYAAARLWRRRPPPCLPRGCLLVETTTGNRRIGHRQEKRTSKRFRANAPPAQHARKVHGASEQTVPTGLPAASFADALDDFFLSGRRRMLASIARCASRPNAAALPGARGSAVRAFDWLPGRECGEWAYCPRTAARPPSVCMCRAPEREPQRVHAAGHALERVHRGRERPAARRRAGLRRPAPAACWPAFPFPPGRATAVPGPVYPAGVICHGFLLLGNFRSFLT